MSLQTDAAVALSVFPHTLIDTPQGKLPLPVVMVSIGGAESGWNDQAQGDFGLPGPSCDKYTSWGWLQIHSVHSAYLTRMTGSSNPCAWANWLYDPTNCAQAALAVLGSQLDLNAWTTWQTGAYLKYIDQAQSAVAEATVTKQGPSTSGILNEAGILIGGIGTILTLDQLMKANQRGSRQPGKARH